MSENPTTTQTSRPPRTVGISILAVYYVLVGVVSLLAGLALTSALIGIDIRGDAGLNVTDPAMFRAVLTFIAFAVIGLATGLFLMVTGYGLWRQRGWARITALCFAAVSLIAFPLGTTIGLVTIVYLIWFQDSSNFD